MNIDKYQAAADVQLQANRLAQDALAPYWDSVVEIAKADDMIEALNEHALCIEDTGELTLAIGGPGVWLLPTGVLAAAWWGPRVYAPPITAEQEDAAETVVDYIAELRSEGLLS